MIRPLSPLRAFGLLLLAAACGSSALPCEDTKTCPEGGDAGVIVPTGCDLAKDPKDSPACIDDSVGLFVDAASGLDANPGTKAAPLKSITAAIAKAGNKPRIHVCAGSYPEHVKLSSPISLFGGFECGSWAFVGSSVSVAPADEGSALEVISVAAPIAITHLSLVAADATGTGKSSIAAFVFSSNVRFSDCELRAGKGTTGKAPPSPPTFSSVAPTGKNGLSGGLAFKNPACPTSVGGAGGKAGAGDGTRGEVGNANSYPPEATGAAGRTGGANCGSNNGAGLGGSGSYGLAGGAGTGASLLGTVSPAGWQGGSGATGGNGGDGQGGGGGAQLVSPGVGGGGGPGGCGGVGGAAGEAGGSSIALLSNASTVALERTTLAASDAGSGGRGGDAQIGQAASSESPTASGPEACAGGYGGPGGSGGGGGGGAGGVSIGVLYTEKAPTIDGAVVDAASTSPRATVGNAGQGGAQGKGGLPVRTSPAGDATRLTGADGTAGVPGVSAAVHRL